jgi:hypothetical protein
VNAPILQSLAGKHVPVAHATQVPVVSHTIPLPHIVPAFLLVVSVHTWAPEEQTYEPFLHGFVGMQVPVAHGMHVPVGLQTMPDPQPMPAGLFVVGVHTGAPVVQEKDPFWHMLGGWQDMLIMQVTQVPAPSHTMPVPHGAPGALFVLSAHTAAPVAQEVAPVLQALFGFVVHDPVAQATQAPTLLHTIPVPHRVPGALFVDSTHAWDPLSHENVPFLHGLVG